MLGLERVGAGKAVGVAVATAGVAVTLRLYSAHIGQGALDSILLVMQANSYAVYVVLLQLALRRVRASKGAGGRGPRQDRDVRSLLFIP